MKGFHLIQELVLLPNRSTLSFINGLIIVIEQFYEDFPDYKVYEPIFASQKVYFCK